LAQTSTLSCGGGGGGAAGARERESDAGADAGAGAGAGVGAGAGAEPKPDEGAAKHLRTILRSETLVRTKAVRHGRQKRCPQARSRKASSAGT
jgi:hypothetical protein